MIQEGRNNAMPGMPRVQQHSIFAKALSHTSLPQQRRKRTRPLTILLSILALLALIHYIAAEHSAPPTTDIAACTRLLHSVDYTKYIAFQPETQEMAAVQFLDGITGKQPAALVQVTTTDSQRQLAVYIYGCSMQNTASPTLTLRFKQQGLVQGDVTVTRAHTLSIGQLDTTISQDSSVLMQPLQQNIYREYTWQHNSFVQTIFPSLYPVTSRSEGEELQDLANNGQTLPWNDPLATTQQMAKDLLQWSPTDLQVALQKNDGTTAHVLVIHKNPHVEMTVTLNKLIRPDAKGLWFVTGAQTAGITLHQAQLRMPLSSPMTLSGTTQVNDGETTTTIFDHTLRPLKILNTPVLNVDETGAYTTTIAYTNGIANQSGLLLLTEMPPAQSTEQEQLILIPVLLG